VNIICICTYHFVVIHRERSKTQHPNLSYLEEKNRQSETQQNAAKNAAKTVQEKFSAAKKRGEICRVECAKRSKKCCVIICCRVLR